MQRRQHLTNEGRCKRIQCITVRDTRENNILLLKIQENTTSYCQRCEKASFYLLYKPPFNPNSYLHMSNGTLSIPFYFIKHLIFPIFPFYDTLELQGLKGDPSHAKQYNTPTLTHYSIHPLQ